jgi:hypothetical protein
VVFRWILNSRTSTSPTIQSSSASTCETAQIHSSDSALAEKELCRLLVVCPLLGTDLTRLCCVSCRATKTGAAASAASARRFAADQPPAVSVGRGARGPNPRCPIPHALLCAFASAGPPGSLFLLGRPSSAVFRERSARFRRGRLFLHLQNQELCASSNTLEGSRATHCSVRAASRCSCAGRLRVTVDGGRRHPLWWT